MNKFYLLSSSIFLMLCISSCDRKDNRQVEFIVEKENIKHAIDSLISLEKNKGLLQELCIDFNGTGYRLTLASRKVSYQEELGAPFLYYLSNDKIRINVYSGIEKMLQPVNSDEDKSIKNNVINNSVKLSYWIIDIDYYNNYKVTKVTQDLPFVGYQENDIVESD